jgi:hypothetical protein
LEFSLPDLVSAIFLVILRVVVMSEVSIDDDDDGDDDDLTTEKIFAAAIFWRLFTAVGLFVIVFKFAVSFDQRGYCIRRLF